MVNRKFSKRGIWFPVKVILLSAICFTASGFFKHPEEKVDAASFQDSIASLVTNYLQRYHYQQYKVNDQISKRVLEQYLDNLDPNKMYFLASDIADFSKYENALDDDLKARPARLDTVLKIHKVFRQRVLDRVAVAKKLLDKDFDFSKEEFYVYDREELPWAKDKAELDELWRLRVKEEMLSFKLRDKPEADTLDLLRKRYERAEQNVGELEKVDVVETFLSSLASTFDPHSSYLKPATKDNFDIQMGHSLEGIGATLQRDGEYTKIISLVKGGPADLSGQVKPDDRIIAVGQEDGTVDDVVDMRLDKVVKKIRGKKGTKVRLTIIPGDSSDMSKTKEVTLVRDRVELKSRDAKAEIHELEDDDGKAMRVGVINIPSFYLDTRAKYRGDRNYKSTTRDVRNLIEELDKHHVDGIVIDLRSNGGGSLDEAIQLTGLFIHYGPVVQIKDFTGKVDVEIDPDPAQVYEGPLVVLTSVFSASASEIFASAIQDYGRGVVVGARSTHGKGTVQNVAGLQSRLERDLGQRFTDDVAGALKITTHKFYRVSGGSTQAKGVEPDIVLPSPYDGLKVRESELDFALPWDEIDQVAHRGYNLVSDSLPYLKSNSSKRVSEDPEFRYAVEDTKRLEQRREENKVTLNMAKRLAEKDEDKKRDELREEERKIRKVAFTVEPLFPDQDDNDIKNEEDEPKEEEVKVPDFVLEETVRIMRDYVTHRSNLVAGVMGKKDSL